MRKESTHQMHRFTPTARRVTAAPNGDRVSSLTGMVGYAPTHSVSKTDALLLRYIPKALVCRFLLFSNIPST